MAFDFVLLKFIVCVEIDARLEPYFSFMAIKLSIVTTLSGLGSI